MYILTKVEEEIAKRDSMYITAYLLNYWHGEIIEVWVFTVAVPCDLQIPPPISIRMI